MSYTRDDFSQEFQLSANDVRETLNALGVHPNKKRFSEAERSRFAEARKLLEEGAAASYEDLEAHFRVGLVGGATSDASPEYLKELERQAVEAGFELGLQQGQIMGQVIPHAAVMRLKEMIATGELKANFQAYWDRAMQQGKSPERVDALMEECWSAYRLERSQPPMSLPESSTASSDSD